MQFHSVLMLPSSMMVTSIARSLNSNLRHSLIPSPACFVAIPAPKRRGDLASHDLSLVQQYVVNDLESYCDPAI